MEVKPKTEAELTQDFIDDYNKLCEKHGRKKVTTPVFMARDDGTFSLVLQESVGKIAK